MLNIYYPDKYQTPESRIGTNFKFYKIEPFILHKKNEPSLLPIEHKKEFGNISGRISILDNWSKNPQQGNINFIKESILESSFSDIIDEILQEYQ